MKVRIAGIAIGFLMLAALPALSQQTPPRPGRAPLPHKPPTVTAVNPPRPGTGPSGQNGIIFVGGAQQNVAAPHINTGYAALNTQPIPPGHAATPVVGPQVASGYAALNTQPIPPGHALGAPRLQ